MTVAGDQQAVTFDNEQIELYYRELFRLLLISNVCVAGVAWVLFISMPGSRPLYSGSAIVFALTHAFLLLGFARGLPVWFLKHCSLSVWMLLLCYICWQSGGNASPAAPAMFPVPLFAVFFLPLKHSFAWLLIATCFCLTNYSIARPTGLNFQDSGTLLAMDLCVLLSIYMAGFAYKEVIRKYRKKLALAHSKLVTAENLAAIGEISAGISHEINNPLSVISLRSQNIMRLLKRREEEDERYFRFLNSIEENVQRITAIVRGIRAMARQGESDPRAWESLREILNGIRIVSHARLERDGVGFKCAEVRSDLKLFCRSVQISQVLINLINNSCDAVKPLSERWIEVSVDECKGMVRISVTDSGQGITDALAKKIMEPFFTTKSAGKGTGLGLSLSARLIQDHGGSLTLDRSQKHTCFVITLPDAQETKEAA